MKTHQHHLVPKHRGGTDEDGLVEVTPTQHAMWHYAEWRLHGRWQDKCAWRMLVGSQKSSREGVPHTPEAKQKQSEVRQKAWENPELRDKMQQGMRRAAKKPERLEALREQGRKSNINDKKHEEKRLRGLRQKCEIIHRIEKDGVVEHLTKKQFVERYGGTLGSCKAMVWRKGAYRGWKFD